MKRDETGLAWSGSPKPQRTGGFVGSVSMNTDLQHQLAVDPNGVAAAKKDRMDPGSTASRGGASVDVQVMGNGQADPRERRSGRFKMPLG